MEPFRGQFIEAVSGERIATKSHLTLFNLLFSYSSTKGMGPPTKSIPHREPFPFVLNPTEHISVKEIFWRRSLTGVNLRSSGRCAPLIHNIWRQRVFHMEHIVPIEAKSRLNIWFSNG
jgi:hypothetical protein